MEPETNGATPGTPVSSVTTRIVASALIAAVVGAGITYAVVNKKNSDEAAVLNAKIDALQLEVADAKATPTATPTASPSASPTADAYAGWKTYTSTDGALSFRYPDTLKATPVTEFSTTSIFGKTGTTLSLTLTRPDVQGAIFYVSAMTNTIEQAIAYDASSFGSKTGTAVTIGGHTGETLKGAFYGMQYVRVNNTTYFFQQSNGNGTTDMALFDKIMTSVTIK